jgi:hypothetical protein
MRVEAGFVYGGDKQIPFLEPFSLLIHGSRARRDTKDRSYLSNLLLPLRSSYILLYTVQNH